VFVDLRAVTHRGSAAISALFGATQRAARHETRCTLIAPPGSTAQHVLSLVGCLTCRRNPPRRPTTPR